MTATHVERATEIARVHEDVLVGELIVRHRLSVRIAHWTVAGTFVLCLVTGMPIWTPIFGWMAGFVGGLSVCRVVHPYAGVAFAIASLVMFVQWAPEMRLEPQDRRWLGPRMLEYMRYEGSDEQAGKYNGGQKLFFWAVMLGTVGLLLSGFGLWFPVALAPWLRWTSILLHDVTFILFAVAIVLHVYLGTAAEPGTFGAMTRGTVTRSWARFHHPRWYREVTGEQRRDG